MNSIPMTADGLKEQYALAIASERLHIENMKLARVALNRAIHDREKAYRRWQDKLKEAAK